MKLLYPLWLVLLLIKPALADSTLSFRTYNNDTESLLTYQIKDQKLRLIEENSHRINIYDKTTQVFTSTNEETSETSRIDSNILARQIERLNKERMKKLVELENQLKEKLKAMGDKERQVAESLINQLKYPEFYGAHTFIKIEKTKQSKTINNIDCDVYHLKRNEALLKQICIASNKSLKLNKSDYDTLCDFYKFNYNTQTRLMLAIGRTDFTHIDYQQENIDGIPIEVINKSKPDDKPELMLENISIESLKAGLFESAKGKKVD